MKKITIAYKKGIKTFDLSTLWHKVLDVNTTNYFQVLEEVKTAVNNGDIDYDEFREMCKQLGKFRKFFIGGR